MAKFKVGDKVEVISTKYYTAASIGDKGTVVKVDFRVGDDSNYAVRMDRKNLRYHTCNGLVPWGYGQNLWGECLKLVEEKPTREFKLIITSSGDTTTAKLIHGKDVAKEATVTRYSKDEYSEKAAVRTAKNTANGLTIRRKTMNNFIELHRHDGVLVLINTRHISAVTPSERTTTIFLDITEDSYVSVTESYEEVKQLLATVEYVYKEEE
jgi:hypothetical protein